MEKILMHATISRAVSAPWKLAPEVRDSEAVRHLVNTRKHLANQARAVMNAREDVEATGRTTSDARPTPAAIRNEWLRRRVVEAVKMGIPDADLEAACLVFLTDQMTA